MWFYLALLAAIILGLYDICKKQSVKENAVLPVLFFTTLSGSLILVPPAILSITSPVLMKKFGLFVPVVSLHTHVFIFLKSFIVSLSWIAGYFALKHLPITVATPIRAAGPFFTLLGALLIFQERPALLQWAGIIIILISFQFMSKIGKFEGLDFKKDKWILVMILSTVLASCSSLYDKYLLQTKNYHPQLVLTWFSIYLVLIIFFVLMFAWFPHRSRYTPFRWRWSIPAVGVLLIIADAFYFRALHYEGSLVIVISAIRRFRVFVAVIAGGIIFREHNKRKKSVALAGIVMGILLILLSR